MGFYFLNIRTHKAKLTTESETLPLPPPPPQKKKQHLRGSYAWFYNVARYILYLELHLYVNNRSVELKGQCISSYEASYLLCYHLIIFLLTFLCLFVCFFN